MAHAKAAAPMIPIEAQILRRVVRKGSWGLCGEEVPTSGACEGHLLV